MNEKILNDRESLYCLQMLFKIISCKVGDNVAIEFEKISAEVEKIPLQFKIDTFQSKINGLITRLPEKKTTPFSEVANMCAPNQ